MDIRNSVDLRQGDLEIDESYFNIAKERIEKILVERKKNVLFGEK